MNLKYYFYLCLFSLVLSGHRTLAAQERVYVSTDKEYYLAGESIWYSVYCLDESQGKPGTFSAVSSVAYLELYNTAGLAATIKAGLINGRGCGKFDIPFTLPTGNYSILAYTRQSGGDAVTPFRGKIITLFNTLTNERVKEGVEIVDPDKSIRTETLPKRISRNLAVEIQKPKENERIPILLKNTGEKKMSVNISVYHLDPIARLIGEYGYDNTNLLDRTGDFRPTGEVEYEGEIIHAQIYPLEGTPATEIRHKEVFLSVLGENNNLYISKSDSLGQLTYHTGNIHGQRDLVFDVIHTPNTTRSCAADTCNSYRVEIINPSYLRKTERIPQLRISAELADALSERSQQMQIIRRFEADTLNRLLDFRRTPLLASAKSVIYNLDEYTRFPLMEEVVREYVKELRLRTLDKEPVFQILLDDGFNTYSYSKDYTLVLLDGIPIRNHAKIAGIDPLLIRQIILYPTRILLRDQICEGVVDFRTYKGDLGGISLPGSTNIINYKGIQYPLAFTGERLGNNSPYPNYNQTVYWNPLVEISGNGTFSFECILPQYKGEFKIVVEGLDENGNDLHYTTRLVVE